MKLKVIKGLNQVGGAITEIVTIHNTRILIDFGKDLEDKDEDRTPFLELEGLTFGKKEYDAVFITHSHPDHIGLVHKIMADIPVYIEEKSLEIHNISCDFMNKEEKIEKNEKKVITFNVFDEKPIIIKNDIKVTPYFVDHSAYNSCMFLIEADGKRILHTGDFRKTGRNSEKFNESLEKIGKVDVLITEGTTLSRKEGEIKTEFELEESAREIFAKYKQVLILESSTNIDRLVSFYNARGDKSFVIDTFTEAINSELNDTPKYGYPDIYLWHPNVYKNKPKEFKKVYMLGETNYDFLPNFIMLVKQSMIYEIRKMVSNGMINPKECLFVYSMWKGYLDKNSDLKNFVTEIKSMGINYNDELHTSGHASKEALKSISEVLDPKITYVIHTCAKEIEKDILKNYTKIEDGIYYDI